MSDAFISCSDRDRGFVDRLQTALKKSGRAIWVNEADAPSDSRWTENLKVAIADAYTFVFVISPDSVSSEACQKELAYAVELNKRIILLNLRDTPIDSLPESVRAVQVVPPVGLFEDNENPDDDGTFEASLRLLITTIDNDPEPDRERTVVRATRLRVQRLRRLLTVVSVALVVVLVLGATGFLLRSDAVTQRNHAVSQAHFAQSEEMVIEAAGLVSTVPSIATLIEIEAYERSPISPAQDALALAAGQPVRATLSGSSAVSSVAYSPNGRTLAVGAHGGDIGLWSTATAKQTATLSAGSAVFSVAYSPNGKTLAVGIYSGDVQLWDLINGKRVLNLSQGSPVYGLAFSPNGKILAAGSANGDVGLWDTTSWRKTATLAEGSSVVGVAFSPNGQTLAAGAYSGDVGLWDVATGKQTATLAEGSPVLSVAFSPNGQTLAVGDTHGNVGLWSMASRKRSADLAEHNSAYSLAFSPNGQLLAVGAFGGDIGLWNTASRKRIDTFSVGTSVHSVAFSPQDTTFAAGEDSGNTGLYGQSLWSWNFASVKNRLCRALRTNMTKAQWSTYVPGQPYQKTCPRYK